MRFVTYQREGQSRSGALLDDKVVDLNRAYHQVSRPVSQSGRFADRAQPADCYPTDQQPDRLRGRISHHHRQTREIYC